MKITKKLLKKKGACNAVIEYIVEKGYIGMEGLPLVKKLIEDRNKARLDKDFKRGDEVRKMLSEKGIILEDTKDGTTWRRKI